MTTTASAAATLTQSKTIIVRAPATGEEIGSVPVATRDDV